MKLKRFLAIAMILILGVRLETAFAAPEPSEVKKIKDKAPVHLKATVLQDELFKDLTKEKGSYYQIRKMKLKVNHFIINLTNEAQDLDIYYSYIPAWQADKWVGGKNVDIAVGDEVEIWLEKGEYGLEPALGGYTVEHLKYASKRKEPIPEPLNHMISRKVHETWVKHSSLMVIGVMLLILSIISFNALHKKI
ncbi:hypothetical protein [Neobacillus sp. D3-1R]|uniref:hypothetical protein n=1 Tax=Neobacillus sp. D3-1R TaxID=3445778 RepID=UPI003FA03C39